MTFWSQSHPKANKSHVCILCRRKIAAGESYLRGFGADGGRVWTWKECVHCEAFRDVTRLDVDEEYGEIDYEEYEPRNFVEAIWKMRWKHGWRHGNGDLVAIPTAGAA